MAALLVVLVVLGVLGSCAQETGPMVVGESAPAEQSGAIPTAPPTSAPGNNPEPTAAGSAGPLGVAQLVARIDALVAEDDLCTLLTGAALADVTGADLDLTSLLQDTSGFTTLFSSLGRLFAHMVDIAPSEVVRSDLDTMRGVWQGVATLDPRAPDAADRAGQLIADPAVQRAQANLGVWVQSTCAR